MTDPAATLVGVKYSTAIAGFFGSVVALTFAKELTILRLLFAILTGSLTAHYSTAPLTYYLKVPVEFNDSLAFGVGLLAMSLIPPPLFNCRRIKEKSRGHPSKISRLGAAMLPTLLLCINIIMLGYVLTEALLTLNQMRKPLT